MAVSDDKIQVSVTLPRDLVEKKIDIDAKKEMRSRSKEIAKIVIDYYNNKNES